MIEPTIALTTAGHLRALANRVDELKHSQHPSTSVWAALHLCSITLDVCRAFIAGGAFESNRIITALNEATEALHRA